MANSDRYFKSDNSISTQAALQSPLLQKDWYTLTMSNYSFTGDKDPSNRNNDLIYLKRRDMLSSNDYLNRIDWGRIYNSELSCYTYKGSPFFGSKHNMPVPTRSLSDDKLNTITFSNIHGEAYSFAPGTYYIQYASIAPYPTSIWWSTAGVPSTTTSRTRLDSTNNIVIFDLCAGGGGGGGGYYKTATFESTSYAGGQGGGGGSAGSFLIDLSMYSSGIKLVVGGGGGGGAVGYAGGAGGATTIYNASSNGIIISMYGGKGGACGQKNTSDTCSQAQGTQQNPGGVVNEIAGIVFSLRLDGTNSYITGGRGGRGGRRRYGMIEKGECDPEYGSTLNLVSSGAAWHMMYKSSSSAYTDMISPVTIYDNKNKRIGGGGTNWDGADIVLERWAMGGGGGASYFGGHVTTDTCVVTPVGYGYGGGGGVSYRADGNHYEKAGKSGGPGFAIIYC